MLARRAREPIFGYVVSQNDQVVTILAMHVFAAATNTPIDRRHEPELYLRLRDPSSWDHSGTSLGTPLPDQLQRAAVCARSLFRVRPDDLQELHLAASDPAGIPNCGGQRGSVHLRSRVCPSPATVVAASAFQDSAYAPWRVLEAQFGDGPAVRTDPPRRERSGGDSETWRPR